MTVSDQLKLKIKVGNLNPFPLSVSFTSSPPTAGGIDYSLDSGEFRVRRMGSVTKTILLTASEIT